MPDRLEKTFRALRKRGEKAMGLFLTSGFPDPQHTLPLLRALDRGGADFLELGMPFSDPLAEGKPIQRASTRALDGGTTLDDTLETVRRFRAESRTPLLLMGYLNPLLCYGPERFCQQAAAAGADGLILPDLPPEESTLLEDATRNAALNHIFLIAPNTPSARIKKIDRRATGFVYAVSVTGLTGSTLSSDSSSVEAYLKRARSLVRHNPLLVGFGIKSYDEAARLSRFTDGFIVGSALIERAEALWANETLSDKERLGQVEAFARRLKIGPDAAPSNGA